MLHFFPIRPAYYVEMQDFEKLGVFYLGKALDDAGKSTDTPLLYESKDLLTHALCVGMTGSGKTGLCVGILEEAAIDGIPAIAIDPKGDLSNLLLTFPELRPEDFRPWINEEDAARKSQTPDEFAAAQAALWEKGLASFGEDKARIARLKQSADFAVYTPGSKAGLQLSILQSFEAPSKATIADQEAFGDLVSSTAANLLGLMGIDGDDAQSREVLLLTQIFSTAWQQGQNLNLESLIAQIQTPPFAKVGVIALDTFFPPKERFALAMRVNNLLASPSFQSWTAGEPLNIDALLFTPEGKPRISILSIAHLNDSERMFFVTLLLNQMLAWVRRQTGTSSLRAVLYMDEIFGYFPPVANPPSKKPLLTLLKQARAFGLGVVLATQNPVDLDYKGLANTGTWLIGRLQTERDKERVLDGLEGAANEGKSHFDRQSIDRLLSGLGSRKFLLNNVHDDAPLLFETRWTLSYLRGPLTREQISQLMAARKPASSQPAPTAAPDDVPSPSGTSLSKKLPVLPPGIDCYYLPAVRPGNVTYTPVVLGAARVRYLDDKRKVDEAQTMLFRTLFLDAPPIVDWAKATALSLDLDELEKAPVADAAFTELPAAASDPKLYPKWTKAFTDWVFQTQQITLLRSESLEQLSRVGESERDFRARLSLLAREERDRISDQLKQKYAAKFTSLTDRKQRAEARIEREKGQQNQAMLQTAVSIGTGLLGAFLGRKTLSVTNLSRAGSAARQVGRSWQQNQDVNEANESLESINQQIADLNNTFQSELTAQQSKIDPATETFEKVPIRLKKTNIQVQLVALAWDTSDDATAAEASSA